MFFKLIYSLFIFLINSNKLIMSEAGFNRYIWLLLHMVGSRFIKNNWVKKVIYDFPSIK